MTTGRLRCAHGESLCHAPWEAPWPNGRDPWRTHARGRLYHGLRAHDPVPEARPRRRRHHRRAVHRRRTRPRDRLGPGVQHLAGLRAGPPVPGRCRALAHRVLAPGRRLPRDRADRADGPRGLARAVAGRPRGGAGPRRVPAGRRAGGPGRRRRVDGERSVVGDGPLRDGAGADRRRGHRRRAGSARPDRTAGRRRPRVRAGGHVDRRRDVRAAARRHVRARLERTARVHGLATDGRQARAGARRCRHHDVPASRPGLRHVPAGDLDGGPGADLERA